MLKFKLNDGWFYNSALFRIEAEDGRFSFLQPDEVMELLAWAKITSARTEGPNVPTQWLFVRGEVDTSKLSFTIDWR